MRKIISFFLTAVICTGLCCSALSVTAFAATPQVVTGTVRDTSSTSNGYVNWEFSYVRGSGTATLTLSGNGYMPNATEDSWHFIDQYQSYRINKLIIKEGVRGIMNDAFAGEYLLKSVTLPSTLVRIGEGAFVGTSITSIKIPKKVEKIDGTMFPSEKMISYQVDIANPYMTSRDGVVYNADITSLMVYPVGRFEKDPEYELDIPDTVTEIGPNAFINSNAKSYKIPGSVKEIKKMAFAANVNLTSVKFENGLQKIYDNAFFYCPKLNSVNLPRSVDYIGYNTFGMVYDIAYDGVEELLDENNISHPSIDDSNIEYYTSLLDLTPDVFVYCCPNPDFIMYVPKGSVGMKYAQNYGLKYSRSEALIPELLSTSASAKGVKISWSKSGDATGYNVYRKDKKGNWILIKKITSNKTLSYTDPNPYSSYKNVYTVRAYVSSGESAYNKSGISHYYITTPVLKSATNYKSSIKVTWDKVEGATKYRLYKKVGNSSEWITVADTTKNYFSDSDVKNGVKYTYSVRAYDNNAKSFYNTEGITRLRVGTPSFTSVYNNPTGIKFIWKKVSGADSYIIYRKTGSGDWKAIKTLGESYTSYTDKSVEPGVTYSYSIRAVNDSTNSYRNSTNGTIMRLENPVMKSASNAKSSIKVTWGKVDGATKYRLYKKVGNSSEWITVADVKDTYYYDKDVKAGTKYTYSVRAYSGNSKSNYDRTGISRLRVKTPAFTSVSNNSSGIKLVWGKISGADSYIIYRKTGSGEWVNLKKLSSSYTSYTDKTAVAGVTYTYAIRAVDGSTNSYLNDSKGTVKRLKTPSLSGKSTKKGIKITYDEVKGASGYNIYRKASGSSSWTKIGVSKGVSTTSYLDTSAVKGKTYIYTVRAYSGSYKSGYNSKGVTVKDKY